MAKLPKLDRTKKINILEEETINNNIDIEKTSNIDIEETSNIDKFLKNNLTTEIIKENLNSEQTDNLIKSIDLVERIKQYKELKYSKEGDVRVLLSEDNKKFLDLMKNVFKISFVDAINLMIDDFKKENKKVIYASKEYKKFKKSFE